MSASKKPEKWFLVQWNDTGNRDVVSSWSVVGPANEAQVGSEVTIERDGKQQRANIIGSSRDRQLLEQQISPVRLFGNDAAGPSTLFSIQKDEPRDFSPSGSSWVPSDDQGWSSDDDDDKKSKTKKNRVERLPRTYSRSSKILKPTNRVEALIPNNFSHRKRKVENIKQERKKLTNNVLVKRSLPDSTRSDNYRASFADKFTIYGNEIYDINYISNQISAIVQDMKQKIRGYLFMDPYEYINEDTLSGYSSTRNNDRSISNIEESLAWITMEDESICTNRTQSCSEESHRSDDNVLITNKYDTKNATGQDLSLVQNKIQNNETPQKVKIPKKNKGVITLQERNKIVHEEQGDWISIGSGKTFIHKSKYKKVNWKSYTIATRTLLLAVFPRRILATHSLTGKRSPAFQNKPAKMCLDPKLVTDVIIEITSRFPVKDSLVRNVITTKCADECKMLKMRLKGNPQANQENVPPEQQDNGGNPDDNEAVDHNELQ